MLKRGLNLRYCDLRSQEPSTTLPLRLREDARSLLGNPRCALPLADSSPQESDHPALLMSERSPLKPAAAFKGFCLGILARPTAGQRGPLRTHAVTQGACPPGSPSLQVFHSRSLNVHSQVLTAGKHQRSLPSLSEGHASTQCSRLGAHTGDRWHCPQLQTLHSEPTW